MSQPQPTSHASEGLVPAARPQPVGPFKNPSYPQRVHVTERAHWKALLAGCEEKLAAARTKLGTLNASAEKRAAYERIYAQLEGARDQVAEAVRRLPGEVGGLYHEDLERLEQAVAAMDRTLARWDAA